jgi:uncharacterized protein YPO0396
MSDGFLEFADSDALTGYRLARLEVYNWGTFHNQIYTLNCQGYNTLLTGDIGSGKSTLVDAVTTLLVPAHRVAYNKAAGAGTKERSLRSYVLGHYKSERSDLSHNAKPVSLRDQNDFSVILGVFFNPGYKSTVSLAQVFWPKDLQSQPQRFFVVADQDLSIGGDFSGFGSNMANLKKKLRSMEALEGPFDSFKEYSGAFRRRLGLVNEQALELFHQTVSMKSVGDLTGFVRQHMLEPFDMLGKIDALIQNFNDLDQAHKAILQVKKQIALLEPLVRNLDSYQLAYDSVQFYTECRGGLEAFYSALKLELAKKRRDNFEIKEKTLVNRITSLEDQQIRLGSERDDIRTSISQNGGDRIQTLEREIRELHLERDRRKANFQALTSYLEALEIPITLTRDEDFEEVHRQAQLIRSQALSDSQEIQNQRMDLGVDLRAIRDHHQSLLEEIQSLEQRTSNISYKQVSIRSRIAEETQIPEDRLPFAGELIRVREEDAEWEGAIERVLHNFGLSLLVAEKDYHRVSAWVDENNLQGRLVYYKMGSLPREGRGQTAANSLVNKIQIRPGNQFEEWLGHQLTRRFDLACCETLDEFHRLPKALTKMGQIKSGDSRHEKDDRHALGNKARYILGWSNRDKIVVLKAEKQDLENQVQGILEHMSGLDKKDRLIESRKTILAKLETFSRYQEIHWQQPAQDADDRQKELQELQKASQILDELQKQLRVVDDKLFQNQRDLDSQKGERAKLQDKRDQLTTLIEELGATLAASPSLGEKIQSKLAQLYTQLQKEKQITLEGADGFERSAREEIQRQIDNENKKAGYYRELIIQAMEGFRRDFPALTRDLDVSLESGQEYRGILQGLLGDDLPRFEQKFKILLNENTINEIAGFNAQLNKENQIIKERVDKINKSMSEIDYNPGRYIRLELIPTTDTEIRDFRQELKACTQGSLGSEGEDQYNEHRFLQVKQIIDRFKGREGLTEIDKRWRDKVCDVRNWFNFAASERWREGDEEYEHYTDSGGKSGGQKEKLAYTVLAASLAYQFGLEWGEVRSRSFRFVVIDEAFGRGSDESTKYGLELFQKLNLQLLIVTPLQKITVIEPYVSSIGFVTNPEGKDSKLRNLSIETYYQEKAAHGAVDHA